jgi:hypothetical protein
LKSSRVEGKGGFFLVFQLLNSKTPEHLNLAFVVGTMISFHILGLI